MRQARRLAERALGSILLLAAWGPGTRAQSAADCLACHGDPGLAAERGGRSVPLHVDAAALQASVHKDLACVDCHTGFKPEDLPHAARIRPVSCEACHGDTKATHAFHQFPPDGGARPAAPACAACHGRHDISAPGDAASPQNRAHRLALCGRCHAEVVDHFRASAHGRAFAAGGPGAPDCLTCHRSPITARQQPGNGAALKIAQEQVCLSCHLDNPEVRARVGPGAGFIAAYDQSVHGAALKRGEARAANCVDCHGSHEMERGDRDAARVNRRRIPETCGACHADIARTYALSVHGQALARGNHEAPVCTDCHGEHEIFAARDPRSPVAAANVSVQVCSPCHSSIRMERKYGIASDRFKTFADSYHGLAMRGGSLEVANCASCHGSHDIRPSSDPQSSINPAHLADTCGSCHPGANQRFAVGRVHVVTTAPGERLLHWIAVVYIGLIGLTIGGMLAHNALDFVRRARLRIREREGLAGEPHPQARGRLYLRMTLSERLQHGALLISFFILVITGFMVRDPDAFWVAGLRRLIPGLFDLRSRLHRIAGVVLLLAGVFHLLTVAFGARGRKFLRDILPARGDLAGAVGVVRYNLGLAADRPRFGRFSYVEKSEYWALVWGTIIMGATGAILWFENTSIGLLTKLGWDVARTIHYYEAWLATLAILVWHFYFVIFNPEIYPMSLSWLTGRISEAEMRDEHPLELEAIERAQRDSESSGGGSDGGGTRST